MSRKRLADIQTIHQHMLDSARTWEDLCELGKEWCELDFSEDYEMTETGLRKLLQNYIEGLVEQFIDLGEVT